MRLKPDTCRLWDKASGEKSRTFYYGGVEECLMPRDEDGTDGDDGMNVLRLWAFTKARKRGGRAVRHPNLFIEGEDRSTPGAPGSMRYLPNKPMVDG